MCLLLHRKLFLCNNKRSAGIALQRNGIMPQKRPAAGGESCEHDSFYSFLIESASWNIDLKPGIGVYCKC